VALVVKSFVFEDPSFRDTPEVVNDEGTRVFLDQIRSPMQKRIAVIMQGTGGEAGDTIVKVIKEYGSEQYEIVYADTDAHHWAVNDYGEVLLHAIQNSSELLMFLSATGDIEWVADVTGLSVVGVALGTSYAIAFLSNGTVKFYNKADGSLANTVNTGAPHCASPFFCSHDGYWGVCEGGKYAGSVLFVSVDGEIHHYYDDSPAARDYRPNNIDAYASVAGGARGYVIYRTGEIVTIEESKKVWVAPSGDCAMVVSGGQIKLYSITKSGCSLMTTTPFADGQSGCKSADISFYGKYALILHDTDDLCVYDLKNATYKDYLDNPLGSRAVMACAD